MVDQGVFNDAGTLGKSSTPFGMELSVLDKKYRVPMEVDFGIVDINRTPVSVDLGVADSYSIPIEMSIGVIRGSRAPVEIVMGVRDMAQAPMELHVGVVRTYRVPVHVFVWTSGTRQVHARVNVFRSNGTPEDITEYLRSVEIELGSIEMLGTGTGADIGVRNLTFELFNDRGDSFAPRDKTSSWNTVGSRWEPLLWPYRGVTCEVAVTEVGGTPTEWATLFEGYLGDNITADHHGVSVSCRDKSKRLQDAYIDVPKTYDSGPYAAEDLIQAIINDYVDQPPTLYCPVPSGITFDEMKVEYIDVWTAVQNVAAQVGWFLGYRWNGTRYALTFMEPPRDKTSADFHFDWEENVYRESLDIGDADIRNALTLTFRDSDTGERVTLSHRDHSTLRNDESIQEYTRRIMQIEEADISLIDTQEKALRFGEKIIWDLSELSATDRLELPLNPELDIFSTFTVENPLISSTIDFFSVQSIRHTLRFGEGAKFRTEVIATGRVVGAKSKWFDMETRPGRPGKPIDGDRIPPGELPVDRLPDYSIGVDKFVESVKPVLLVSTLPILPDPRYPENTIVFLITDEKLYRNSGGTWVKLINMNLEDLEGKLQSNQIALDAITEDLIAADAITETKISDGAIDTPKLAAGAVTAAKIAARTITALEIKSGAITANEIAAATITASEIAAYTITAAEIASNAITAGKVQAGVISYDKLDVAYATVASVSSLWYNIGGNISGTIEQVANNQSAWNVVKLTLNNVDSFGLQFNHNSLNVLMGLVEIQFSANGISWTNFGLCFAEENNPTMMGIGFDPLKVLTHKVDQLLPTRIVTSQHIWTEGYQVPIKHTGNIWIRFRRHSIT